MNRLHWQTVWGGRCAYAPLGIDGYWVNLDRQGEWVAVLVGGPGIDSQYDTSPLWDRPQAVYVVTGDESGMLGRRVGKARATDTKELDRLVSEALRVAKNATVVVSRGQARKNQAEAAFRNYIATH